MAHDEQKLDAETFVERADELLENAENDKFEVSSVRALLLRSPLTGMYVLENHGMLLKQLLENAPHGKRYKQQDIDADGKLLGEYFNALTSLPSSELMADFESPLKRKNDVDPKPIYDALNAVAQSLIMSEGLGATHPALLSMQQHAHVDPTALLLHLTSFLRAQVVYLKDREDMMPSFTDTAQGCLLMALEPLMLDSAWRPSDPSFYEQFWMGHQGLSQYENTQLEPRYVEFVRIMMAEGKGADLHYALGHLRHKVLVRDAVLEAFFPLPLEGCETPQVLENIVHLVTEQASGMYAKKSAAFTMLLGKHHPEVASMLQMNIQLFQVPEDAQAHYGGMLESFERILSGGNVNMVPLPGYFSEPEREPNL